MQLLDAAAYISKQFKYIGLSVDERELPVKAFKCDNVEVKIDFPENKIIKSKVLTFSKETPKEGLSSEIVNGYIGTESDLEKAQVKDKLVVIQRGGDTFRNKTEIAAISISKVDAEYINSIITSEKGVNAAIKVDSELKKAGINRYHNNLETSRRHFPNICTTHTYEDKITTIKNAQIAGLEVCSGGIIGLGETFVSALLVKKLREDKINEGYYKPALSGAYIRNGKLIPGDAKYVCNISGLKNNPDNLVSYSLKFLI